MLDPGAGIDPPWKGLSEPARMVTIAQVRQSFRDVRSPPAARSYGFIPEVIKPSAALVPVVDIGGEAAVLVTKRPSTMEFHGDDWVFPGGRLQPSHDGGPLDAALRETEEEIGVLSGDIDPLGHLCTYGPFITGFLLHVFVGVVGSQEEVSPDVSEVAEVAMFPLSHFMSDGVYSTGPVPEGHYPGSTAGRALKTGSEGSVVRFFRLREGQYLWGTQGEIIWDFLARVIRPYTVAASAGEKW